MKNLFLMGAMVIPLVGTAYAHGNKTSTSDSRNTQSQSSTTEMQRQDEMQRTSGADETRAGRVSKETDQATPKLTVRDRKFVEQAASANLAEVKLGQLALEKTQDPQVRQFAQKMVNDHQRALDQLKNIASKENMPVPQQIETKDQAEYDRLSRMEGKQFDQAYMQHMVTAHDQAVSMFQTASNQVDNDELRNYASTTLPKLKEHQQHAVSDERDLSKQKSPSGR